MIIKVSGICQMNFNSATKNPQPQIKFYNPQTTKEEVKKDFHMVLDAEIKKLKFEAYV